MMSSASQKTMSIPLTVERNALFSLGLVALVVPIPLTGISFPGRTSFVYRDKAIKEVGS